MQVKNRKILSRYDIDLANKAKNNNFSSKVIRFR